MFKFRKQNAKGLRLSLTGKGNIPPTSAPKKVKIKIDLG